MSNRTPSCQDMAKVAPMKTFDTNPEKLPQVVNKEAVPAVSSVPFADIPHNPTERSWIPKHINKRICKWFIPRNDSGQAADPLCHCMHTKSRHTQKARRNHASNPQSTHWKPDSTHTEAVPTDAFGDIEFVGYGKKSSKFVRVDHETPMSVVLELMIDQWRLDPPNLLISVTGGARKCNMHPRLSQVFRRGLMKAASSTGAWIITGGMHAGVMKLVGQAVADWMVANGTKTKVTAIGIAPWGCVNNKESLLEAKGNSPAQYRLEKAKLPKHSPIDLNHSHFMFVDNGTQQMFATEIAFRAQLEKAIGNMKTSTGADGVPVPVVCVVVEGGPGTLETVMSALQSGTPAVIVEGTGRAADILAYAYWNSHEIEVEVSDHLGEKIKKMVPVVDDDLMMKVRSMIVEVWGTRDLDLCTSWVKLCLQHRGNMTVFQMDGKDGRKDIDFAILQALLKANQENVTDQLKLALAWNRIDIAKSEIFTEDRRWEKGELDNAMYMALINNRHRFVKLFLENGLSLKDFLTIRRLLQLYNDIPENCPLRQILTKRKSKENNHFSLEDVGKVIQTMIGDFYIPLFLKDQRYRSLQVDTILRGQVSRTVSTINIQGDELFDKILQLHHDKDSDVIKGLTKYLCVDSRTGEQYILQDFTNPARELFVWAVLLNRFELASVLWEEGKESIPAALVAQNLLRSLQGITEDSELEKEIQQNIQKFSGLAVGVLSECYMADEEKAGLLLVRQLDNFGETTALQLAVTSDNKAFIAHAACQSLLNTIWRGHIAPDISTLKMWVCILCPPLLYVLIRYQSVDLKDTGNQERSSKVSLKVMKSVTAFSREFLYVKDDDREMSVLSDAQSIRANNMEMCITPAEIIGKRNSSDSSYPLVSKNEGTKKNLTIRRKAVSCFSKLISFYNAPVITFIHNCLMYVAFLVLYSYVLLVDFQEEVSVAEYIIVFWIFTLLCEELRQVVADESVNLILKLQNYISEGWNIVDVLTILTFVVGFILRLIANCPKCFEAARIILAINLMIFFFRILHICSVHKELGPKLVMIGRMMIDLMYFCVILVVFITAYGLASQAILYPNTPLSWRLFHDVFHKPYWQIYGELFLEELEGSQPCTDNRTIWLEGSVPRCPANNWIAPILLSAYILVTNVLMLNLLIAMFSYTFDQVQEENDLVWHFQKLSLIREYYKRPPLAPPFVFISHVYALLRFFVSICCKSLMDPDRNTAFKMKLTREEQHQLILWENMNQEEYIRNTSAASVATLKHRVKDTQERVDQVLNKVEELVESSFNMSLASSASASSHQPKLPPVLDERMTYLEDQMKRTAQALDWIIKSMVEKGSGMKEGPPALEDIDRKKQESLKKKEESKKREKQQYEERYRRQLELHVKARTSPYQCAYDSIYRFTVPDDFVAWETDWPEYSPITHTDRSILDRPPWADIDLIPMEPSKRPLLNFNDLDGQYDVDRRSHSGTYKVTKGLPINPKGRTGVTGRGLLGRWGPNHAGDPIVTRWAHTASGEPVIQDGMKVLEFVSVQRQDCKQWAIPGGLLQFGQRVEKTLKAEFTDEALGNLPNPENRGQIRKKLDLLFTNGTEVYVGYMDDPRNTDNAWVETRAVNFHDEEGILTHFTLRAGETVEMVRWMKISTAESLYASHLAILQKVAKLHKAAF